jgi:hypothetical protein
MQDLCRALMFRGSLRDMRIQLNVLHSNYERSVDPKSTRSWYPWTATSGLACSVGFGVTRGASSAWVSGETFTCDKPAQRPYYH